MKYKVSVEVKFNGKGKGERIEGTQGFDIDVEVEEHIDFRKLLSPSLLDFKNKLSN